MRAITYQTFGNTDVLQAVTETTPSAKSNEVLVKIKAVSVNPMDWKIRKGEMKLMSGAKFPRHTGVDFAGVIEDAGNSAYKKGDEVFGVVKNMMKDGALAEYVAVPASLVWKKPRHISFAQAASIPVVGVAAVTALEKMGKVDAQTKVLVNGATGGFGMFLLQLLRQRGAAITAVASTMSVTYAKQWGANTVIDYMKEDVLSQNVEYDIIIDLSGKMGYAKARKIMKPKSLFLNPVPKPIEIPASIFNNIFTGKKHIVILTAPSAQKVHVLMGAIDKGLQIAIDRIFPFNEVREAYRYAEKGGVTGKVVIEIDEL